MKKSTTIISTLSFILIFNLAACAPGKFVRYKSPKISGEIFSNQQHATDINIYLSINENDKECLQYIAKTSTDDKGQFSISAIKENMNYTPLMLHYFDEWTLCIDTHGSRKAIYSNNRYDQGGSINSVQLICELKNRKNSCHETTQVQQQY